MHIIDITSTNPRLSYILAKNPATIKDTATPFSREMRKGMVYGWFTNEAATAFRILFIDHPTEVSFSSKFGDFEYLDTSRYLSPSVTLSAIDVVLSSAVKTSCEDDLPEFQYSVEFCVFISDKVLKAAEHFYGILTTHSELCKGVHRVVMTGNSMKRVLCAAQALAIVATLDHPDFYVLLKEENLVKYIRLLGDSGAGYYLTHLFCVKAFSNIDTFNKVKGALDKIADGVVFEYGNSQTQRHYAIRKALLRVENGQKVSPGESLVDIGCGELFHSIKLSSAYPAITAVEADPSVAKVARARLSRFSDTCVGSEVMELQATAAWVQESPLLFEKADVLLSEVLEHNPKEESLSLLRAVVQSKANVIVATVPCRTFNPNYFLQEGEFRHPDHKWEPSLAEWITFCSDAAKSTTRRLQILGIGDSVRDVHSSLMAVFYKE